MEITIAIATWNRAGLLGQTLASLTRLRWPAGMTGELLVCDNNSSDATRKVVESFPAGAALGGRVPVRYLFEPTQGKSHALNRILAAALGDWVLFLDDDVLVEPQLMEIYVAGIARYPQAVCLGGPIEPWLERPVSGRQAWFLREYPECYGLMTVERDTPMQPPRVSAWGANMLLRRAAIPPGGFSLERGMIGDRRVAGEDVGIQAAMLRGGGAGWLLAGAAVRHFVPRQSLGVRRLGRWQTGIGATWVLTRGRPEPGRLGVPWWAWRELGRRALTAASYWRPWPTRSYYDALSAFWQWRGYLCG